MIVLDASALYPIAKSVSKGVAEPIKQLLEEGIAVLDLTLYEVVNAAVIEARRGRIRDLERVITTVSKLAECLEIIRVEPGDLKRISVLGEQLGLTAYDAAYVYYARLRKAKLLTNDEEILEKARDVAINTDWLGG